MISVTSKPKIGELLNTSHPLQIGLCGYWVFNEGAGAVLNDISPFRNSAQFQTGISAGGSTTSGWKGSPNGGGFLFDGSDDAFLSSTTTGINSGKVPRSTSVWVNQSTRVNGTNSGIVSINAGAGAGGVTWTILLATVANKTYLFTDSVAVNVIITGAEIPSLNVWHHIVFSYDGTNYSYYLDGRLTKTGALDSTLQSGIRNVWIGRRNETAGAAFYTGYIDELRIYNRALTQTDVTQLYTTPHCDFFKSPYRYYSTPLLSHILKVNNISYSNVSNIMNVPKSNISKIINIS